MDNSEHCLLKCTKGHDMTMEVITFGYNGKPNRLEPYCKICKAFFIKQKGDNE